MAAKNLYGSPHVARLPLSPVERELVGTVLEDCVDHLAVLGGIMPNYTEKASAVDNVMGEELRGILENQRQLETKFENLTLEGGVAGLKDHAHSLSATTQVVRSAKTVQENLEKLQSDREFLRGLVGSALSEISTHGTFASLTSELQHCHEEKVNMEQAILREEESRKRIRQLKRQLTDVHKEKEEELTQLNETIAHLKDKLQEEKAKSNLVSKQTKKECQVEVEVVQRKNGIAESGLNEVASQVGQQLEEEAKASQRIEEYLKKHYEELAVKVDHWMTKYEQDIDMKSRELHDLKTNKANGLQRLAELSKKYKECEEVVVEHRALKERARLKAEQEASERKGATKLQAWWRGIMVRKCLGTFAKGKKKKGKGKAKGKKGKKGKKKKK